MLNLAWKEWAVAIKNKLYALYLASGDPRVSIFPKLLIVIIVAYALSPIDLIPDFIPVIGYLDDLVILPIGIWLAIHLIPAEVWSQCLNRAREQSIELPRSRVAATVIVIIWVVIMAGLSWWLWNIYSEWPSPGKG